MTGKELVLYLIQNDLLDKELEDANGVLPLCCSVDKAAEMLEVGPATIDTLCALRLLNYYPKQVKMDEKFKQRMRKKI